MARFDTLEKLVAVAVYHHAAGSSWHVACRVALGAAHPTRREAVGEHQLLAQSEAAVQALEDDTATD